MAKLSKALGVALTTTFFVALIALLAFQFIAIAAGLEVWGLSPLLAYLVAAGVTGTPIVGSAAGAYSAVIAWGWTAQKAVLVFFAPLILVFVLALILTSAAGGVWAALTLRNWRRGATQPIQLPLVTVCPKCGTEVEIMQRGLAMRLRSPDKCQHRSDGRLFECQVMQQAIDTATSNSRSSF